ncbi:MAG: nuclear transport factor 2 family protein [Planctomycetota bacterium]|jgi:hypothetical protein
MNHPRFATVLASLLVLPCLAAQEEDRSQEEQQVKSMLNALHIAAAVGDGEEYFRHFDENAILLATDPDERWDMQRFHEITDPVFAAGEGWTTLPMEQHVYLSADGQYAWFDERLKSARYGEMRGTGLAHKSEDRWRILQFNTVFTIPNEVFNELVERIDRAPPRPVHPGSGPGKDAMSQVMAILTRFHQAGVDAKLEDFLGYLHPQAIFFGTDPKERFSVEGLEAFLAPHFAEGQGWSSMPVEQNVYLAEGRQLAWFDQRLRSDRFGEMRGSGVLIKDGEDWKIVQYAISLPIPNDLVPLLLELRERH